MTYLEKSLILRYIRECDSIEKLVKAYDSLPYKSDNKNDCEVREAYRNKVWEAYRNKLRNFYGDFTLKESSKKK